MNHLRRILETKREEVARIPPAARAELRALALSRNEFRSFRNALQLDTASIALIAEVKKASPSAGLICTDFDPVRIAKAYESGGAHAISVLTDEQYFQGSLDDLRAVRAAVNLPVLRKDFIIHEAQIFQAGAAGADAVLLIVAALDQPQLVDLLAVAAACQLDVLVEVHSMHELDRALETEASIIGINNRDLTTFVTDLKTTSLLAEQIVDDVIVVSESGIKTAQDVAEVFQAGANAILVGETLMRTPDPTAAIRDLLNFVPHLSELPS